MRSSTLIGGLLVLFCSFQKIQSAKEYWWMNDASVFGGSNSNNIGQNQQQPAQQQQQQFQNYPNFPQQQQQNQQISEFSILLIFTQCGNLGIFPSLRFYVKSILVSLEVLKMQCLFPTLGAQKV